MYDVNQYIFKYWQYMEVNYEPQSPDMGRFFLAGRDDQAMEQAIRQQSCHMICVNDAIGLKDFARTQKFVHQAFESILPDCSSFEKE
jgi:hypothetical protein